MTIAGILLCLTLVSVWLVGGLYARYTTSDSSSDSARVAAFVFNVSDTSWNSQNTHMIDISGIQKPGDEQTYAFIVRNNTGTTVSEVCESYTIDLKLTGGMPLTAQVSKDSSVLLTLDKTSSLTIQQQYSLATAFEPGTDRSDTYQLYVTWPSNEVDASFANGSGVATVTLTVTGTQVD